GVLRIAQKNALAGALAPFIRFERRDAALVEPPPGSGLLAVNPPYGVRLPEGAASAWRSLATLLERLPGWTAVVLGPDRGLERLLGRTPAHILRIRNGGLACQLLFFGGTDRGAQE
ncbi:MAG TPA: RNA methyltransferase, partial [Anaeromyxobacteraceae bacterium]